MPQAPLIYWFRRDLRLGDHVGLTAAVASGRAIIPVFIHDEIVASHGAAPKWRLGLAVEHFAAQLEEMGSRLILRRGNALEVLRALAVESGSTSIQWSRSYDPAAIARDTKIKAQLHSDGFEVKSHTGHLLFEPWSVQTKTGGFYKVFTPMWRAVRDRDLGHDLSPVTQLPAPRDWPSSENIASWAMGKAMQRGAAIVAKHVCVGEARATARLDGFIQNKVAAYPEQRDCPGVDGTSRLSENLTYGEISPRTCWTAGMAALTRGEAGAEVFLRELVWREFAYHLAYHTPHILTQNWNETWSGFPWQGDGPQTDRWKQGRTGIQFVDAALREMYVTGTMHNRGRMIVASYLTKHMMTHWSVGAKWFEECLIDWDPASNAMGWQWAAGSGPDAAPYFRVFNPDTQAEKFDATKDYRARFLCEAYTDHGKEARDYFNAIPKGWGLMRDDAYPSPLVTLKDGHTQALDAYKSR
jgi:deoxyribodipyrimidine photo-lyase